MLEAVPTVIAEATRTGLPITRPLYLAYPGEPEAYATAGSQYGLGHELGLDGGHAAAILPNKNAPASRGVSVFEAPVLSGGRPPGEAASGTG